MDKSDILKEVIMLDNGVRIPQFGFGTYLISGQEAYNAVMWALEAGYRHIDTAEYYNNEVWVGQAIIDFLKKYNEFSRKDIFITSKIWNSHQNEEQSSAAIKSILERLKVDYLDLCLIHWPTKGSKKVWKALEKFYKYGKIKAIGVSNFKIHHLKEIFRNVEVMPLVNQIETHPGWNQTEVVEFCRKNKIAITSWRTMVGGEASKFKELVDLANKYKTTATHIALRWAWQLNQIVIPKSVNKSRIESNPDIGNFMLTNEEMQVINNLPQQRMGPDPDDERYWNGNK